MSPHPSTLLGWARLCHGVLELLLGVKTHLWVLPELPREGGKAPCPHHMWEPPTVPSAALPRAPAPSLSWEMGWEGASLQQCL